MGALLESIAIAATGDKLKAGIAYRPSGAHPDESPVFDIAFEDDPRLSADPLLPFLKTRTVNRWPMKRGLLSREEKSSLSAQIESFKSGTSPYRVLWLEGASEKRSMARISQRAGRLRLTIPEAYAVHRKVIEWNARTSLDRIPDQALGISRFILPLMRWIMGSWPRVRFFSRYLGGTLLPRLELDILPALFCSAHFVILAPAIPVTLADYVDTGRALCRFWLETARQGLLLQPEMAPILFRAYAERAMPFSERRGSMEEARKIASALTLLIGPNLIDRAVFLGRVGRGNLPRSRSLRLPLTDLSREEVRPSGG